MPETQIDRDVRTIFELTGEEATAIADGDLAHYLRLLADDAVFMPPNSPERTGQDLRRWLGEFLDNVAIAYHSFHHGETLVAGDLACHVFSCSWTASPKSKQKPALFHFKGLHLLRRQPDGSWRITREIWNLSPAP
jgi:ketosteroid isomerase-like protein